MKIEVKIENKGELIGTLGWLKNEVLKDSYLSIRKLKGGYPGMFLIGKNKQGNETKDLICFVSPWYQDGYQDYGNDFWAIYPEESEYEHGFCGKFTEAAKIKFNSFIDDAVDTLREYMQEVDDEQNDFSITIEPLN